MSDDIYQKLLKAVEDPNYQLDYDQIIKNIEPQKLNELRGVIDCLISGGLKTSDNFMQQLRTLGLVR